MGNPSRYSHIHGWEFNESTKCTNIGSLDKKHHNSHKPRPLFSTLDVGTYIGKGENVKLGTLKLPFF